MAMVRSEGNMSLKKPVTPPGIDPWSVRIVAQRLNHYAIPVQSTNYEVIYYGVFSSSCDYPDILPGLMCVIPMIRDTRFHLHGKQQQKIIVLCTLIFALSDSGLEWKRS